MLALAIAVVHVPEGANKVTQAVSNSSTRAQKPNNK